MHLPYFLSEYFFYFWFVCLPKQIPRSTEPARQDLAPAIANTLYRAGMPKPFLSFVKIWLPFWLVNQKNPVFLIVIYFLFVWKQQVKEHLEQMKRLSQLYWRINHSTNWKWFSTCMSSFLEKLSSKRLRTIVLV